MRLPKYAPRDVSSLKLIDKWKANEVRSFFLFVWYPCISPKQRSQIYELFASFIAILSKSTSSSTYTDIGRIDLLCKHFLDLAGRLFCQGFLFQMSMTWIITQILWLILEASIIFLSFLMKKSTENCLIFCVVLEICKFRLQLRSFIAVGLSQ